MLKIETLDKVINDIKRGENIDLYLTIPVAILVGFLNLVGLFPPTLIPPLTLVVLGLITVTILGSRHRVEQLAEKLTPSVGGVFVKNFPHLDQDLESASDYWFVGLVRSKPVRDLYSIAERKLRQGHSVKILTVHPDPTVVEFVEMRTYGPSSVKMTCADIEAALEILCHLKQIAPDKFMIRTIRHPLSHGVTAIDPNSNSGILYINNYSFKTTEGSVPKFLLRAKDGDWYNFYRQELYNLWEAGVEWKCVPSVKP
jgi:hypothetical protein